MHSASMQCDAMRCAWMGGGRCASGQWAVGSELDWLGSAAVAAAAAHRQSDGRRSAADTAAVRSLAAHKRLANDNTQQQSQQCDALASLQHGRRQSEKQKKNKKEKRKHFSAELPKRRTSNSFKSHEKCLNSCMSGCVDETASVERTVFFFFAFFFFSSCLFVLLAA